MILTAELYPSRGIIKYYQKFEDGEERFVHYTREAVLNMRKDIYGNKSYEKVEIILTKNFTRYL